MSSPTESIVPRADDMSDAEVQALLAQAVQLYAERVAQRDEPLPAFPADAQITATEAMLTVSAIMKAVNVQIFELGMWQAWSGR